MTRHTEPLVSVITVNFNGEEYLPGLLSALQRQTYPRVEVILVDNASSDGSIHLVEDRFPDVRIIRSLENLGFAGGNNRGIREARGDYVALINNDTVPENDWLARLVETAEEAEDIAAVGSKILFARPFLPLTLQVKPLIPDAPELSNDPEELRVLVSDRCRFQGTSYRKKIFADGFRGPARIDNELGHWTYARATLLLPTNSLRHPGDLILRILGKRVGPRLRVEVLIGDTRLADTEVTPGWQEWRIAVPTGLAEKEGVDVINNAASFLEPDGTAGDRGIFEPDRGQYDTAQEVTSLCGCAMLLSRVALARVGTFDEDFFMYFEDTELSWRLRKAGYRLWYQPASVVRHFHASTSGEWSPMFNFLVARNRILMLLKHGPLRLAVASYLEELGRLLKLTLAHRSLGNVDVRTRVKIQWSLLRKAPKVCLKRWGLISQ